MKRYHLRVLRLIKYAMNEDQITQSWITILCPSFIHVYVGRIPVQAVQTIVEHQRIQQILQLLI